MADTNDKRRDLEEEVFKTLSHQVRRDILRVIGESKGAKFTEIKNATGITESASLSYHLSALSPLLSHEQDLYKLSGLGRDTYSLMNKLALHSTSAEMLGVVGRKLGATITANSLMWTSAILYLYVAEGPMEFLTLLVFVSLFSVSNLILYSIVQYTQGR
ncbi:MAG: hypothetical protein ACFFEF_06390 [Candidatus Thorarchaeota archaeon]